jgi:hypothetical protein
VEWLTGDLQRPARGWAAEVEARGRQASTLCLCVPLVPFACARSAPSALALGVARRVAACACASPGRAGDWRRQSGREAESGCWALAGGGWPGTGGWDSGSLGTAELGRIRFSRTAVGLGWAGSLGRAAAGHLGLGQNDDCWTGETLGWRNCSGLRVPMGHPWVK